MNIIVFTVVFAIIGFTKGMIKTVTQEMKLHKDIFIEYNKNTLPILTPDKAINVSIVFHLLSIIELNEKNQILTTNGWLQLAWTDVNLQWNQTDYDNVSRIFKPQDDIWRPDIVLDNTVNSFKNLGYPELLVEITSDGTVSWDPGDVFMTSCDIDITGYPLDTQTCQVIFSAWMHTSDIVNINTISTVDVHDFTVNGQWHLDGAEEYVISQDTIDSLYITLTIRRRQLFFIINILFPIMMLSFLNSFVFILPVESGEKITLSVTLMLSFAVFINFTSSSMPNTSVYTSVLAVYLAISLALSALSIILTVLILHLRYCANDTRKQRTRRISSDNVVKHTKGTRFFSRWHFFSLFLTEESVKHAHVTEIIDSKQPLPTKEERHRVEDEKISPERPVEHQTEPGHHRDQRWNRNIMVLEKILFWGFLSISSFGTVIVIIILYST